MCVQCVQVVVMYKAGKGEGVCVCVFAGGCVCTHMYISVYCRHTHTLACTPTLSRAHIFTLPLSHTMHDQREMTTRTKTNKRVGISPDPQVHSGIYVIYIYIYIYIYSIHVCMYEYIYIRVTS